jgi:TRAP-type C4-dicarboxylate transport system permease small subunit
VFTLRIVRVAAFQRSPALEIPMSYIYWGMVAGGAYLAFVALRKLVAHWRGGAGGAGAAPVEAPL